MKRVTLLIPALIVLLSSLPFAVFADTRSKDLPQDRQAEGKFAIDSWESGHVSDRAPGSDVVYHRITFAEPWDNDLLRALAQNVGTSSSGSRYGIVVATFRTGWPSSRWIQMAG